MFAVIKTGGKQYRVAKNDVIVVERLAGEPGSLVELRDVLMIGESGKAPSIGLPRLEEAAVFAEVIDQARGDKIIVFKKKRRQNYRRKRGHRQDLTVLRVVDISATGTKPEHVAKVKKKIAEPEAAPAKTSKGKAAKPAAKAKPKAPAKAKDPAKAKAPAAAKEPARAKGEAKAQSKPKPKAKAKKSKE